MSAHGREQTRVPVALKHLQATNSWILGLVGRLEEIEDTFGPSTLALFDDIEYPHAGLMITVRFRSPEVSNNAENS